ncbi:Uncharacterised protein [Mycobacterium tuberculosis]|nr:Uncharacterised protein [Mycobacterium tuberculosis]
MSRAGDDAERSDEEERRMSVMNGREVARESRDAQVFEFGTAPGSAVVKIPVTGQPSCVVESPDGKYLYIADYSGTITRTAVASTIVSGTEQLALQRRGSMQWFSPELQQYAPALA